MVVAAGVTVTGAPELTAPTPWSTLAPSAFTNTGVRVVLVPAVTAWPLATAPMPWSMTPAPPENSAVSWLVPPAGTVVGAALNELTVAAGTTVTVTV